MEVYAKSDKESLKDHTENCIKALKSLKNNFPFIPSLCKVPEFWKHLFLSLCFHDLGKTATGFQAALKGDEWNYRHEILSAGFVLNLDLPTPYRETIALSVITHHFGLQHLLMNYRTWGIAGEVGRKRWQQKVDEMKENQSYLYTITNSIPLWSNKYVGEETSIVSNVVKVENCQDALNMCAKKFMNNELTFPSRLYPIFMRGLTIACDHLSSGHLYAIRDGISETFSKMVRTSELKDPLKFQETLMNLDSSACLNAPTGAGKTAASLLWCQANQDYGRRIFYILPYTASINAMQRRLKSIFTNEDVGIIHHKATYSLYKDFLEQKYSAEVSLRLAQEVMNVTRKIYRPIKVLTPYQIIKAFFGIKGFEPMLSEMAGGLFIYDEIHCYEPRTVALIVRSAQELTRYGAKFLFMSATLPEFLRNLLTEATGLVPFITLDYSNKTEKELLNLARHRILIEKGEILGCVDDVEKALEKGDKVLIVCNTVGRAQALYEDLKHMAKSPKLLHGRFIAKDREKIEREIESSDLLVGTQAIEVSLNFDFDTIFTEPAPLDALLQRFGRVNRFGKHKKPVPVHVYSQATVSDEFIYHPSRVEKTLQLLPNNQPLSNRLASELVEELYREGYMDDERAEYQQAYDSFNYIIQQLPLFDASEFRDEFFELIGSVEVVPARFKKEFISMLVQHKYFDAIGYIVPISKRQFAYLNRKGKIVFESGQLFVDAEYDDSLGLILNSS